MYFGILSVIATPSAPLVFLSRSVSFPASVRKRLLLSIGFSADEANDVLITDRANFTSRDGIENGKILAGKISSLKIFESMKC